MRPRARTTLSSEDGYTLIEMVIATAGGLVLMAGVLSLMISSLYAQSAASNRISTLQGLQTSLVSMTNELRPAKEVAYVEKMGQLGLTVTPSNGTPTVTYECSATKGTCVRSVGGKTTTTFATGLYKGSNDVFTLECRDSSGNLKEVLPGGSPSGSGCVNSYDYVLIHFNIEVPCTGQGDVANCQNKPVEVEVDSGTALRNQA